MMYVAKDCTICEGMPFGIEKILRGIFGLIGFVVCLLYAPFRSRSQQNQQGVKSNKMHTEEMNLQFGRWCRVCHSLPCACSTTVMQASATPRRGSGSGQHTQSPTLQHFRDRASVTRPPRLPRRRCVRRSLPVVFGQSGRLLILIEDPRPHLRPGSDARTPSIAANITISSDGESLSPPRKAEHQTRITLPSQSSAVLHGMSDNKCQVLSPELLQEFTEQFDALQGGAASQTAGAAPQTASQTSTSVVHIDTQPHPVEAQSVVVSNPVETQSIPPGPAVSPITSPNSADAISVTPNAAIRSPTPDPIHLSPLFLAYALDNGVATGMKDALQQLVTDMRSMCDAFRQELDTRETDFSELEQRWRGSVPLTECHAASIRLLREWRECQTSCTEQLDTVNAVLNSIIQYSGNSI